MGLLDELLAPDFVDRAAQMGGDDPSAEGFKTQVRLFRTAFPDGRSQIEDLIGEGDRIVARWTDGGTQRGQWMGIAPTGNASRSPGSTSTGSKMAGISPSTWCNEDELGLLRQLGAIQVKK